MSELSPKPHALGTGIHFIDIPSFLTRGDMICDLLLFSLTAVPF